MNTFLDDSLVGLMLSAALAYAFATLGPQKAWRRVLAMLAVMLERAPRALGLRPAAQRLAAAAAAKIQGACGGCDNCASQKSPPAGRTEIRVPIGSIARARPPRRE